jgi:hypothetical protein
LPNKKHAVIFIRLFGLTGPRDDYIQQPGSPGWSQQVCRRLIFRHVLRINSFIFLPRGIGWRRFRQKAPGSG